MNILVTGAGSLVGHGILRSLREIKSSNFKIITADPDYRAVGHWLGDMAVLIPLALDDNYINRLAEIIERHEINVVFIGTDPELLKISQAKTLLNAVTVVSEPEVIKIGDDKWDTVEFLKVNGFPYPATARSTDIDAVEDLIVSVGFPLIAKPRTGARSAGVMKLKSRADLDLVLKHKNYIIQEFLEDGVGEFTAGTMTYNKVCYSCVIFKRDLREGNTFRAYSYDSKEHESLLEKVSKALPGVYGPINFQYRIKNGVPVIFEINSRFSGTTPLRTAIGVNEIEMALDYIENRTLVTHKASKKDIAIFRTWSDVIVPMDQVRTFKESNVLAEPNALYFPFKNEIRK